MKVVPDVNVHGNTVGWWIERDDGTRVGETFVNCAIGAVEAKANADALAATLSEGTKSSGDSEWALRQGDVLADWCNVAGAALKAMMDAYERRIRSLCNADQIKAEVWRCAEFIQAEHALATKPVAVVALDVHKPVPPESRVCADCGKTVTRKPNGITVLDAPPSEGGDSGLPGDSRGFPLEDESPKDSI